MKGLSKIVVKLIGLDIILFALATPSLFTPHYVNRDLTLVKLTRTLIAEGRAWPLGVVARRLAVADRQG